MVRSHSFISWKPWRQTLAPRIKQLLTSAMTWEKQFMTHPQVMEVEAEGDQKWGPLILQFSHRYDHSMGSKITGIEALNLNWFTVLLISEKSPVSAALPVSKHITNQTSVRWKVYRKTKSDFYSLRRCLTGLWCVWNHQKTDP